MVQFVDRELFTRKFEKNDYDAGSVVYENDYDAARTRRCQRRLTSPPVVGKLPDVTAS